MPAAGPLGALDFPPEIILLILVSVDFVSAVRFSATCRTAREFYMDSFRGRTQREYAALFQDFRPPREVTMFLFSLIPREAVLDVRYGLIHHAFRVCTPAEVTAVTRKVSCPATQTSLYLCSLISRAVEVGRTDLLPVCVTLFQESGHILFASMLKACLLNAIRDENVGMACALVDLQSSTRDSLAFTAMQEFLISKSRT